MRYIPVTDHRKQFMTAAIVNGSGMDFALLVSKTVLSAARGLANMRIQRTTPALPMTGAAVWLGRLIAINAVIPIVAAHACKCCCTVPGSVGEAFRQ